LIHRSLPFGTGGGFHFSCSSEEAAILILPNGAKREVIVTDKFKTLAIENAFRWAEFAERNGRTVRWRGEQYTDALPLSIVTEVIKTNEWALTEVSTASRGTGCSLKLLAPAAEGSISGSYSWEIHSPSASRVVPPPVLQDFNHSVFIKALRIKFRRRIPFVQPKVEISVFDKVKPNDTGREFLDGLGEYRATRQSAGGSDSSGIRDSGDAGRDADLSLSAADRWPADEYEVSIESPTDSNLVRNPIDQFDWYFMGYEKLQCHPLDVISDYIFEQANDTDFEQ
jgi:hypothetical protein